jgi:serine phosphatase RsbU (regulator of sigma subunit)/putative methionine-R-sulfoxide reductase with GAF domain
MSHPPSEMKRLSERQFSPSERGLHSVRTVLGRMADVLWQANAAGEVTSVTPCRPAAPSADGQLDETELRQIEQLWRRCARVVERFSTAYHVRSPGMPSRTFLIRAVPVLDERDVVQYWSGIAAETDGLAEADTRFISEAATVLSSSLNRTTIVNRLVQTSIDHFSDCCAVYTFDDGQRYLEAFADRRPDGAVSLEALEALTETAVRMRHPLLLAALQNSPDEKMQSLLRDAQARSLIVVPLLAGSSCIGALAFAESERASSFATRDIDVAIIVGRQLTMAIENIKTFEREQRVTERFRFLARVTDDLFATLDSVKMLELLLQELLDGFADYGVAAKLTDGALKIFASAGTKARFRDTAEREIAAALAERHSIVNGTIVEVGRVSRIKGGPLTETEPPLSWMAVPLFVGDAIFGGILCCSNSHRYDPGELELLEEIGRRASLALEHAESFARERRLIHTLQQATLPTRLATVEGASLSAVYRPAALEVQVGGDWYDAYDLDSRHVLFTVGDVTGHGLEASIVMGKLRHAINVVAMYERDPVQILDAAERILLRRYPGSVATAFVAILDIRGRTISYANAGHPYPVLRAGDGSLKPLEAEGLPIGLRSVGPRFSARTERLDGATLLTFYTDGLTEAKRDMLAGERRLHEALTTQAVFYVANPAEFVANYCLEVQAPDDVAILVVNFVHAQRWAFDAGDWHEARQTRRKFLESISAGAQPGSDLKAAELIFGELAANVAQHAGGRIDMSLEWRDGDAVLHVVYRGDGYATADGLWLIQRLGARLHIERLPGFGTHVEALLPIRHL